jgi:DNA primase
MRTESSLIHARHRRLRVLLAVLAAALFLQACAQDAAPESGDEASAAAEQASTAPAGDGGEAASDAAADDADGGAAAGEIEGVDLTADFCTINNQLDESSIFDQEPESAEDFSATAEQIKEIYRVLAEKAPQEIADDVNFVTETGTRQIDLANELIREAGDDPAQVLDDPEVAEQMAQLDEEGFQEAADRLETWTEENC